MEDAGVLVSALDMRPRRGCGPSGTCELVWGGGVGVDDAGGLVQHPQPVEPEAPRPVEVLVIEEEALRPPADAPKRLGPGDEGAAARREPLGGLVELAVVGGAVAVVAAVALGAEVGTGVVHQPDDSAHRHLVTVDDDRAVFVTLT